MDWGNHHLGTTRMSADPKQGVVDADSKVHGVANLYVAGSSVFPTYGSSNPDLESGGADLAAGRSSEKGDGMRRRGVLAGLVAADRGGAAARRGNSACSPNIIRRRPMTICWARSPTASPPSSLARRRANPCPALRSWRQQLAPRWPQICRSRAAAEPGEAQITEVAGWIVPQSVALYAALAAQV